MYVCGPTVYDDAHIGHGRSYVSFDVMRRYLEFKGNVVRLVINISDLDDVIREKAFKLGKDWESVARHYEGRFLEDLEELNVRGSYSSPRVSEHVPAMVDVLNRLSENGFIYEMNGNQYFRTSLLGGYGQLTHQSPEDALADEAEMTNRENPFDFLIWKKSAEGAESWESPMGPGRPGWHVQCYALMRDVLGDDVDLHGGGEDLKFPHHESTILISLAHAGRDVIGYHVHNGFMMLGKEKMSKSMGNFVKLRDVFKQFSGLAVRFYLLNTHYRQTLDYDEEEIASAEQSLKEMLDLRSELSDLEGEGKARESAKRRIESFRRSFMEAMDEDFDTSRAIQVLSKFMDRSRRLKEKMNAAEAFLAIRFLDDADSVLGLTGAD